jgi:hypothetical protein
VSVNEESHARISGSIAPDLPAQRRHGNETNAIDPQKTLVGSSKPQVTIGGLRDGFDLRQGNAIMLRPGGMDVITERGFGEM